MSAPIMISVTVDQLAENKYRRGRQGNFPSSDTRIHMSLTPQDSVRLQDGVLFVNEVRISAITETGIKLVEIY